MTAFTVLAFVSAFAAFAVFCICVYSCFHKETRDVISQSSKLNFFLVSVFLVGSLAAEAAVNGAAFYMVKTSLDRLLFSLACMSYASGALVLLIFFLDILKYKLFKLDQNSEKKT